MSSATGNAPALLVDRPTPSIALAVIIIVAAAGFNYVASGGNASGGNSIDASDDDNNHRENNGNDDNGDDTAILVGRLDNCDGGSAVDCSYAVCDRRRQF